MDNEQARHTNLRFYSDRLQSTTYQITNTKTNTKTNTNTKTKTKTQFIKDPTCAIFLKSLGFKDIKYDTHASPVHHQLIISASSVHHQHINRPNQDREDFNLADLILELAFLFYKV